MKRILTLILSSALVLSCLPAGALAKTNTDAVTTKKEKIKSEVQVLSADFPTEEDLKNAETLNLNEAAQVYLEEGEYAFFKIVPEESGEYYFFSTGDEDTDTIGYLFDESRELLADNDDGDYDYNFKITYDLKAKTTYYLSVEFYDSDESGSFNVYMTDVDVTDWYVENQELAFDENTSQTITVKTVGYDGEFSYEWQYFDYDEWEWITIKEETNPSLNINVSGNMEYRCLVTDSYGNIRIAYIDVYSSSELYAYAVDDEVELTGQSVTLEVIANSPYGNIKYQWYEYDYITHTNVEIVGATSSTLTVTKIGDYNCIVTDGFSEVYVEFEVYGDIGFSAWAEDDWIIMDGDSATLKVITESDDGRALSYQWYREMDNLDDVWEYIPISGATKASVTVTEIGEYLCVITDGENSARVYFDVDNEYYPNYRDAPLEKKCLHSSLTKHAAVSPSCTSAGNIEYWSCNSCSKNFTDESAAIAVTDVSVSATGHSWGAWKTVSGTLQRTCSKCGAVEKNTSGSSQATSNAGTITTGTTKTVSGVKVKVTKAASNGSGTVSVTSPANKNAKKVVIPATVTLNGVSYKVTAIADNAFKNCKKLTSVTIGSNVTTIGKKAFFKCKSLKKITIKSKKLKSVGKKAIKGINKKAKIKSPKSKKKAYKKLFKANTGYKKTMKLK